MSRQLAGLMFLLVLAACRGDDLPTDKAEEPAPEAATERVPAPPATDPCVLSSIEVSAEGGGEQIPEERVRAWIEDGFQGLKVPRVGRGAAGGLRVVYLLTPLEGGTGWSLGIKALWEVMDGHLRQPISADVVQDLGSDADLDVAAQEAFTGLVGALVFRCRLGTAPPDALPGLASNLKDPEDLVAWARACGDRDITACGEGLEGLLGDERSRVAAAAIVALGQVDAVDVVPAIVKRTARADPLVVRAAVLALGELGTDEARRYLTLWSSGHPDPDVRDMAREMLELPSNSD